MMNDRRVKSERDIIAHVSSLLRSPPDGDVVRGIGDDCAVISRDGRNCFLVSTDTLVEGVHFDLAWHPPALVGRKAAAVNLSDIAAMGGKPRFALLNLAFPASAPSWLDDFLTGFLEVLDEYAVMLVGGDTVKSSSDCSITVTIIGEMSRDAVIYRSGAVSGDLVFVSGDLGNAAAGFALCRAGLGRNALQKWEGLVRAHLAPEPRVALGNILAQSGLVHAMMDISDGLATDLAHLCEESSTGAEVIKASLPVSANLEAAAAELQIPPLDWILRGGEDYQLLFTAAPKHQDTLRALVREKNEGEIFAVGRITAGRGVFLLDGTKSSEITYQGYDHFGD
jgi:thiamine-monophosphate kinase